MSAATSTADEIVLMSMAVWRAEERVRRAQAEADKVRDKLKGLGVYRMPWEESPTSKVQSLKSGEHQKELSANGANLREPIS